MEDEVVVCLVSLSLIVVFTAGCMYKPYTPHSVTFQIVDQNNNPLPNITVSYRDPSYSTDLLFGYTDDNGITGFIMDGSMQYNITVVNPETGVTRSYGISPLNSSYRLYLFPPTVTLPPTPQPTL